LALALVLALALALVLVLVVVVVLVLALVLVLVVALVLVLALDSYECLYVGVMRARDARERRIERAEYPHQRNCVHGDAAQKRTRPRDRRFDQYATWR